MTLRTILHPTDCSDSAARALEVAARFAATHRAELLILHAELLHGDTARETAEALEEYVASARRLLRSLAGQDAPGVQVVHARTYFAHDAILQAATERHADLIVMGTHGRRGFSRLLLGSNAERVLRQAPCHVLTVRGDAALPTGAGFEALLVPVDFSDCSRRGLDEAMSLAANANATIHIVHVIEPLPPLYYAGNVWTRFELDGDLRVRVEERLRTWTGDPPGARYVVREGHAAVEIARAADDRNVDLVVMSNRGASGVEWLLVGSVTERVCRMATVPVLTVRQPADSETVDQ